MKSISVRFVVRTKWSLLILLLQWLSPSQCEMDMESICKTPLCVCGTVRLPSGNISVISLSCRGAGLKAMPGNIQLFNESLEEIDLTGNHLSSVSYEDLKYLRKLRVLILDHNEILTVEDTALQDLDSLDVLRLSNNSLKSIPNNWLGKGRGTMNSIDLSWNDLTEVPPTLLDLRSIKVLKLNNNPLGNITGAFVGGNLREIAELVLSSTGLTEFNSLHIGFDNFNVLDDLFLDNNHFVSVTREMFGDFRPAMKILSMESCGIETIEKGSFETLLSLHTLILNGNNLTVLKGTPFKDLGLKNLYLERCNISDIRKTAFRLLRLREGLYLNHNNVPVVHNYEFKNLITEVSEGSKFVLQMRNCSIERIEGSPFSNLTITHLSLSDNHLTDESMETGLNGIERLTSLDLTDNCLESVPKIGLESPKLKFLYLTKNNISSLTRSSFLNMSYLEILHISRNPFDGFSENDDTFAEASDLRILKMEETNITRLPNLAHLPYLHELFASHSKISSIPENYCGTGTRLSILEVNHNRIKDLPNINCADLVDFEIAQNGLSTLHSSTLQAMPHLNKLDLSDNAIEHLDRDIFNLSVKMNVLRIGGNKLTTLPDLSAMVYIVELNASHNKIKEIGKGTFTEQVGMDLLYLNDNHIKSIHSKAFSSHSDLKRLNLSNNYELDSWTLPLGGFLRLETLHMENLWKLHQVPTQYQIPMANFIHFTYSYHCCVWENYIIPEGPRPAQEPTIVEQYAVAPTVIIPTPPPSIEGCENHLGVLDFYFQTVAPAAVVNEALMVLDKDCRLHVYVTRNDNLTRLRDELEEFRYYTANHDIFVSTRIGFDYVFEYLEEVVCKPSETPLTPCENLMDPWVLRVAIWAVWVIALLGNITVLFVGIVSKEKLEPNEFLICNLAFADLCMGLYLVFLATVDVRTFGSGTFFQSALDWQLGAGCQSAGFIAIFSNELSVFILVVLTLERVYTIGSAFNQDDTKKKRVAMVLCGVGWLVAAVIAGLPLLGVNSYSRVAVCLPYVTETFVDKLYIGIILSGNVIGFIVILLSYVYIFTSACRNTPATYMPQRRKDIFIAASKIAVLILTAFFCWAPTALIGFLALADVHLVTPAQAKYFLVFVFPLNACVNPFIYAIFTNRFRQKFAAIFQRSNDKATSFPPHHSMRLRRAGSAFTSDIPMSRVSSSQSKTAEELTKMRQSRRSNSLVVQFVENVPSPTFTPPAGCNLGRRASLPPGFGSTLSTSVHGGHRSSRAPGVPHCVLPFRIGDSQYSSNTSSLPDLQEEVDSELDSKSMTSCSPMDSKSHPLTSSQESNLRRLSVVKEDDAESEFPMLASDQEDDAFSDSSLEDYVDAQESIPYSDRGTDLDYAMHGALRSHSMPRDDVSKKDSANMSQDLVRDRTRKCSYEYSETDIIQPSTLRRKSSSWSDILSLNDYSLSPLQESVFATVEERFNTPLLFPSLISSPDSRCPSLPSSNPPRSSITADYLCTTRISSSEPPSSEDYAARSSTCTAATDFSEDLHRPVGIGGHQQNVICTTTPRPNRNSCSSSSTNSDQFTGIRQGFASSSSSSSTQHPTIMHSSSSSKDTPKEHANHDQLNNSSVSPSSSLHDDTTDSCTSINIETNL